ncbi:MAG: DUF3592 domain-containing protein [Treponema sp.]|jgi:archaellum component FlaG (FlaF/FlaG flagellin family)|nr:DUF3592 domain-containing protein [Treponema sp.]
MVKLIVFVTVLIIVIVFAACSKNSSITLESVRGKLEGAGEYKIFEHYIPSDHDFPLEEKTTGGFSFHVKNDGGSISSSTSVIIMEFLDGAAAQDYAGYVRSNKDSWITIPNGKLLLVAVNQNEGIDSNEMSFLYELITGKPLTKKSATSQGTRAMVIFLIFGALCTSISLFGIKRNRRLKVVCTSQTTGIVIEVHRRRSGGSKSSYSYYPEFSYTANGRPYRDCSVFGTPKSRFTEGQKVTVHYDPNKPEDYYVGEDSLSNVGFYIFLAAGALLLFFAPFMLKIYNS